MKNEPQFEPSDQTHPYRAGLPNPRSHRLMRVIALSAASILALMLGAVVHPSFGILKRGLDWIVPDASVRRIAKGIDTTRESAWFRWLGNHIGRTGPERSEARYIELGFTKDLVLKVEGSPDRMTDDVWYYGPSEVRFREGKVIGWSSNPARPIKVRIDQPQS